MTTIGLDVGGTKVLGVVVDPLDPSRVLIERRVPTPAGGEGLVDVLAELVEELVEGLVEGPVEGLGADPVSVGVGVPGLVDRTGVLHMGPHLRSLHAVPLARLLTERLGLSTQVDNDANCHALAELVGGAARGTSDALVVTLGTGIGAGIVSQGQVLHGAHGFAGEPGHMVVDPSGPPCPCGKRGCWERYASGSGLARLGREAAEAGRLDGAVALAGGDPDAVRGEHVTAAARAGDPEAVEVLAGFARWIGLGLANLVNILDPELIVIGGGLVGDADLILPLVRTHVAALVMAAEQRPEVPIVPAALGERAGAIGAAQLAQPVER